MGRELVRQLANAGAHVAMCDINDDNMSETAQLVGQSGALGRLTAHRCDVSAEDDVLAFRDAVLADHDVEHIDVLFNNAGIGGGGSIVADDRDSWERTFDICWGGVYLCTRAFMDALLRSTDGAVVNTSSVNGFWASIGAQTPHTSYSAAKFAVKGFTEALIADFRVNAPNLSAHVVMPGHIGTSIMANSAEAHGVDVVDLRKRLAARGLPTDHLTDEELLALLAQRANDFETNAPTTAAEAATVILDGVLAGQWRILVGDDAHLLDDLVRRDPWTAYDPAFIEHITELGHLRALLLD